MKTIAMTLLTTASVLPAFAATQSLISYDIPEGYVKYHDNQFKVTEIKTEVDKQFGTFEVVAGLSDSSCHSFRSTSFPGYYLKASGTEVVLQNGGGSRFNSEATFCSELSPFNNRKDTNGGDPKAKNWVQYQSHSLKGYYLRHDTRTQGNQDAKIYLSPKLEEYDFRFNSETSFLLTGAIAENNCFGIQGYYNEGQYEILMTGKGEFTVYNNLTSRDRLAYAKGTISNTCDGTLTDSKGNRHDIAFDQDSKTLGLLNNRGGFEKLDKYTEEQYNAYYKIHNKAYGEDMCLDVINDGINNDRVHMVPCANFTGQYWKMDKRISTFGFQLTNWWQGDYKCLSIAGEFEDEVRLKDCGAKGENLWSFLYSEDEQGYAELMPEGSEGTLILDLDYATPYLGFESDERSQWIMKKAQ